MKTFLVATIFIMTLFIDGMNISAQTTYQFNLEYPVRKWSADAEEDNEGNFLVVVSERSGVEYSYSRALRAFLLKIDSQGDTLTKYYQFGDTLFNFTGITKISNGGYLVTGFSQLEENDVSSLLLMKIDDSLNPVWVRHHLISGYYSVGIRLVFKMNNGFILTGCVFSYPSLNIFPYFARIDNRGNIMHSYVYPDSTPPDEFEYLLTKDSSQIWLFAHSGLSPIHNSPSRAVFDTSFNHIFSEPLPSSDMGDFSALWYSDTTFLLSFNGQRPEMPYQDDELGIALIDGSLNILQQNLIGFQDTIDDPAERFAIDFKHTDSIYFLGDKNKYFGYPGTGVKSWIMTGQLDASFQLRYLNFISDNSYYETQYIKATRDGGSFICAGKWVPETQVYDLIFLKLNNEGLLLGNHPQEIKMKKAVLWPNPVSDQLFVQTALRNAKLIIYHIDGSIVLKYPLSKLVETIDVQYLSTGMYIYKIITPEGYHENGKFFKN